MGEYGTGGAQSGGAAQYIWLPTASGPLPIVADLGDLRLAVYADHLHTPRGLVLPQVVQAWQWPYGAFSDEQPALVVDKFAGGVMPPGTPSFNLRYPGQYFDSESGLNYNGFRTYNPVTGRYTQGDPIGLDGGWNRFAYVAGNPLSFIDPDGLQIAIPAPTLAPIAGSLVRPAAGTLIDPVVTPGLPDPNDPNNTQKCKSLKKRIDNLRDEIYEKRYPDLLANPGNLPQRIGPGEALRDTVRGHEKLMNRQLRRLRELEEQHDKECVC